MGNALPAYDMSTGQWGTVGNGAGRAKQYSANGELDYLTSLRPGQAPDQTDRAVQTAAMSSRMRVGMGRASTFLTGLPGAGAGGASSPGASLTARPRTGLAPGRATMISPRQYREPFGG